MNLTRWVWLLTLPYVVVITTSTYIGVLGKPKEYHTHEIVGTPFSCEINCSWLFDLAKSLNDAYCGRVCKGLQIGHCPECDSK